MFLAYKMRLLEFIVLIIAIVNSQKYLGGNGDYTSANPGDDIKICLAGQLGSRNNTCYVAANEYAKSFGDIDVNVNDSYTLGSVNENTDPKYILIMNDNFTFTISKNYIIKDLEVLILTIYYLILFFFR
jgi:hypothetical protein